MEIAGSPLTFRNSPNSQKSRKEQRQSDQNVLKARLELSSSHMNDLKQDIDRFSHPLRTRTILNATRRLENHDKAVQHLTDQQAPE
jgi:hypothetical protein